MNYTIVSMNDFASNQVLDIVKDGNTYDVILTDGNKLISYKVKTIKEAEERFNRISNCFINGTYTFEQRIDILQMN